MGALARSTSWHGCGLTLPLPPCTRPQGKPTVTGVARSRDAQKPSARAAWHACMCLVGQQPVEKGRAAAGAADILLHTLQQHYQREKSAASSSVIPPRALAQKYTSRIFIGYSWRAQCRPCGVGWYGRYWMRCGHVDDGMSQGLFPAHWVQGPMTVVMGQAPLWR